LIPLAAAALRRVAHFGRHHCKAAPLLAVLAASVAAFSAKTLFWKTMPPITAMISMILFELFLIESIKSTTSPTAASPFQRKAGSRYHQSIGLVRVAGIPLDGRSQLLHGGGVSSSEFAWNAVRDDSAVWQLRSRRLCAGTTSIFWVMRRGAAACRFFTASVRRTPRLQHH
jgi:hypothetical protein